MTSLDCLVFAAGCVEDPNPAKSSKSPKAEVTHWEELAFCGYKRNIYQIENYFPNLPTLVRIQTQTHAKHLKFTLYRENFPLPPCYFCHYCPHCQLASFRLDEFQCLELSLFKHSCVWVNSRLGNIVCKWGLKNSKNKPVYHIVSESNLKLNMFLGCQLKLFDFISFFFRK